MEETKKHEHNTEHEGKHLEKLTVFELRDIAKEIPGIEAVTGMKKEQLVSIIKKHRGIEDESHLKKADARVALTVNEMKHKISALKNEKKTIIEKHDRKKATILRRRIHRLKKRIRKAEEKAA
jgi:hypothetical protein